MVIGRMNEIIVDGDHHQGRDTQSRVVGGDSYTPQCSDARSGALIHSLMMLMVIGRRVEPSPFRQDDRPVDCRVLSCLKSGNFEGLRRICNK